MAIKILKKREAPEMREAAPLVSDAAPAEPGKVEQKPEAKTPKAALDWWKAHGLPVNAQPRICVFCGHPYLKPCGEENHGACQNFHVAEEKRKARAGAKT